jgi:SNF2 family DNA or RNA helicase
MKHTNSQTNQKTNKQNHPIDENVVFCQMSKIQVDLYKDMLDSKGKNLYENSEMALAAIQQLKKICNHPNLVFSSVNTFVCLCCCWFCFVFFFCFCKYFLLFFLCFVNTFFYFFILAC